MKVKVKELNLNVELLMSLDDCSVYALRYAAKRTIDRILEILEAIGKIETDNKSKRLIELEQKKTAIDMTHSGNPVAANKALQKWEHYGEFLDEQQDFINNPDQKALMEQDEDINVFKHKFKEEYLEEFSPTMKQMQALEIICPNFVEVADKMFEEKEEVEESEK